MRGRRSAYSRPVHQTPKASASAHNKLAGPAQSGQRRTGNTATASSTAAATPRPASQKLMAFSGLLAVTRSGMPAYDRVCPRSIRLTARKPAPSSRRWLLSAWCRRFQASAKTMPEIAMARNSIAVCQGRYRLGVAKKRIAGRNCPPANSTVSATTQRIGVDHGARPWSAGDRVMNCGDALLSGMRCTAALKEFSD